jgi:uncharacterized integral membrane protein
MIKGRMKDFLFTLLAWLLTLPFIIGAVAFALYNPQTTDFTLNPFRPAIPLPVYVPVLGAIAFGFLFGAIMTWAAMGRLRKERRDQRKKIKALEKQIEAANQNQIPPHNYSLILSSFKDK